MQIIVVDKRLARALTLSITRRHALAASVTLALGVLLLSGAFSFLTVRAASVFRIPILSDLISFVTRDERERKDQFVRDNVSALARKLGEVQAQLLRLDAVAMPPARLANAVKLSGGACQFTFTNLPALGFTVLAARNPALPQSGWTVLGCATEISPGHYQFTDATPEGQQRFYVVRSP